MWEGVPRSPLPGALTRDEKTHILHRDPQVPKGAKAAGKCRVSFVMGQLVGAGMIQGSSID